MCLICVYDRLVRRMNVNTKHTPGPWVVFNSVHEDQEVAGVTSQAEEHMDSDGDGADICEMANAGYLGRAQVEANARLIAAAPRLYDFVHSCAKLGQENAEELLKELGIWAP